MSSMSIEERKLSLMNKNTTLNPNAEEFVPSSFKSANDASKVSDTIRHTMSGSLKGTSSNQLESTIPSFSDEEAHKYWQHQLPDDITPDFKALGQDEMPEPDSLSLLGLSISDNISASIFSPNQGSSVEHHTSPFSRDRFSTWPKVGPCLTYAEEQSQASIVSPTARTMSPTAAPWVKPSSRNGGQYSTNRRNVSHYNGDSSNGASLQNLTDAYYGNAQNLDSTMEILSQLEKKVDGRLNQSLRSLSFGLSSPSSPAAYSQTGLAKYDREAFHPLHSTYRSSDMLTDDSVSPSAVCEHVSLDAPPWSYRRANFSVDGLGSSRGSQLLGRPCNGNSDMISNNKVQNLGGVQMAPTWLKTSAEANKYLEPKEDVHDLANPRNAFLEQERQAYLTGSDPLAKELNLKELYNIQRRLAQEKARETIYRQRFQTPELQGFTQEQNTPIDLCGLHVSEALHVLNYELNNRRKIARSTGRRLQVIIISSTCAPSRLTAAVEHHLLEHGFQYLQLQPGLFRVLLQ